MGTKDKSNKILTKKIIKGLNEVERSIEASRVKLNKLLRELPSCDERESLSYASECLNDAVMTIGLEISIDTARLIYRDNEDDEQPTEEERESVSKEIEIEKKRLCE